MPALNRARAEFGLAPLHDLVPGPVQPRFAPAKVLTPPRLAGATARLLARGGSGRRALLGEVGALIAEDIRRKRLARHPRYVPLETSVDAEPGSGWRQ